MQESNKTYAKTQEINKRLQGSWGSFLQELLHGIQDLWQLSLAALWWSRSYEKWGERERRSRVFRLSGSPVAGILGMAGIGACSGGGGLLHGRSAPTANRWRGEAGQVRLREGNLWEVTISVEYNWIGRNLSRCPRSPARELRPGACEAAKMRHWL